MTRKGLDAKKAKINGGNMKYFMENLYMKCANDNSKWNIFTETEIFTLHEAIDDAA